MKNKSELKRDLDAELVRLLPEETALHFRVLPLHRSKGSLVLATCLHHDALVKQDLEFILNQPVSFVQYSQSEVEQALTDVYGSPSAFSETTQEAYLKGSNRAEMTHKHDAGDEKSVVRIIDDIIAQAIAQHASDIHIEPLQDEVRVRFRIDGALHERKFIPLALRHALVSRVKIMAELDIAERRRPQDGRIAVSNDDNRIDIRVSTLPVDFGEKIVLRILDKTVLQLDLNNIGMHATDLETYKNITTSPYGMILVTGPTGSGKTTTLYATLNHLNNASVNILTIEDPVEYNLAGINQSQLHSGIGFTFAHALRTFLRQDPDIIMVGEIRDFETAEIAVRAALTGHLVLSTLHTNDAASAVTRLVDMGVEPFLVASCVRLVAAQRLVRKLCSHCKRKVNAPDPIRQAQNDIGKLPSSYVETGCQRCYQTGFRGRTGLFEVMPISETLAQLISAGRTASEIKRAATSEGMRTLRQSGIEKIGRGLATIEEVLRETVA